MKATDELKKEHDAVKLILDVLDVIASRLSLGQKIDTVHLEKIIEFLQIFVDKCHHAKEERMLFAAMREAGDEEDRHEILMLLAEHQTGRLYISDLIQATGKYKKGDREAAKKMVENIRSYVVLISQHIDRENNGLFQIADERLSEQKQYQLYHEFDKLEEEEIGHGKHEQFHEMIKNLKEIYLGK